MNGFAMPEAITWILANPLVVLAFVILVFVVKAAKKGRRSRNVATDPQRLFKPSQKAEAARRCGNGRCEFKAPLWFRCRVYGAHGDHIYPHSRGGATAMSNLQLLCPNHNLAKSASVPSSIYIWRLQRRRVKYFPSDVSGKVEWRLGRSW
jgi:5-methylcytosine-specific restriction endonuclease McrA